MPAQPLSVVRAPLTPSHTPQGQQVWWAALNADGYERRGRQLWARNTALRKQGALQFHVARHLCSSLAACC